MPQHKAGGSIDRASLHCPHLSVACKQRSRAVATVGGTSCFVKFANCTSRGVVRKVLWQDPRDENQKSSRGGGRVGGGANSIMRMYLGGYF